MKSEDLEKIVENILLSSKYRNIKEKTILEIVKAELPKHKKEKTLIKSVKNKLHQIYGAFLSEKNIREINSLLDILEADKQRLKEISRKILLLHRSTRERIDFYEDLYKEIFNLTCKPKSILDLASGLNPYSIPWMNIENSIEYYAYDIDSLLVENINRFLEIINYPKLAMVKDVVFEDIEKYGDICFIFKFLPIVERIKKGSSIRILEKIKVQFAIVSFPLKSFSGREKGMLENYSKMFEPIFKHNYDIVKRFILGQEVFYILRRR